MRDYKYAKIEPERKSNFWGRETMYGGGANAPPPYIVSLPQKLDFRSGSILAYL